VEILGLITSWVVALLTGVYTQCLLSVNGTGFASFLVICLWSRECCLFWTRHEGSRSRFISIIPRQSMCVVFFQVSRDISILLSWGLLPSPLLVKYNRCSTCYCSISCVDGLRVLFFEWWLSNTLDFLLFHREDNV